MRNFFYGFLIILAAVLVTHTANSSTLRGNSTADSGDTTTVSTRTVACSAVAVTPVKSSTNIVGNGRFVCDSPGADNVFMTVTLQKKASATDWVTVATNSFHASGSTTSNSASNDSRTHGVSGGCATGTFRTAVEMSSTSKGNSKSTKTQSGAVTNPCS